MRYRPLGPSGFTVSALTLAIEDEPRGESARTRMIYAALESGINAFEIRSGDPGVIRTLGRGLAAVERDMLIVSLRAPYAGRGGRDGVIGAVEAALLAGRLERIDILILDRWPQLDSETLQAIAAAKASERVKLVAATGEAFDRARHRHEIDGLVCPYNLRAGWPDRNRIRGAVDRGKFVIGQDSYPDLSAPPPEEAGEAHPIRARGLLNFSRRPPPLEKSDGYAFMRRAQGWSPDEICLAYALTEPGLASEGRGGRGAAGGGGREGAAHRNARPDRDGALRLARLSPPAWRRSQESCTPSRPALRLIAPPRALSCASSVPASPDPPGAAP